MRKAYVFLLLTAFFLLVVPRIAQAQIVLDPQYCGGSNNDYYQIPGEPTYGGKPCSRAPNACGNDYNSINTEALMPDAGNCLGTDKESRAVKGCGGYTPLCCYEMARTGDFTKCIGYWERLWCAPSQCQEAVSKGASDSQCGGNCQCSHASRSWCIDTDGNTTVPVKSLSERIGGVVATITPTPTGTQNTPTPSPTGGQISPTPTSSIRSTSTPIPTPTVDPACLAKRVNGDYNCDDSVTDADYSVWKDDYRANYSTLSQFEYWRRAFYKPSPTPTTVPTGNTTITVGPTSAIANATLLLSPETLQAPVLSGQTFSVDILLSTDGRSVDSFDALVSFNPSQLQVVSLTSNIQVFPSYILTPTDAGFDNTAGEIDIFGQITPQENPTGVVGTNLKVTTIVFRAVSQININSRVTFNFTSIGARNDSNIVEILTNQDILRTVNSGTYQISTSITTPTGTTVPSSTIQPTVSETPILSPTFEPQ
jgi:hypothetical protein